MFSKRKQRVSKSRGLGLLGLSLLIGSALLAACGSEQTTDSADPPAAASSSDEVTTTKSAKAERLVPESSEAQASVAKAEQASEGVEPKLGSPEEVERNKGGDNSIQDYGDEVSEAERKEAATVLTAYLSALAEGDTETACALFSAEGAKGLADATAALASSVDAPDQVEGCPEALKLMSQGGSAADRQAIAKARVLSVRLQGSSAFAIYTAHAGTQLAIPMAHTEAEGWRVANVAGSPIG